MLVTKEKLWLICKSSDKNLKKNLKSEYCSVRSDFDRLNRKLKRRYQLEQQYSLNEKLINPRAFWKIIEIGMANVRQSKVPIECYDNDGSIIYDTNDVLDK